LGLFCGILALPSLAGSIGGRACAPEVRSLVDLRARGPIAVLGDHIANSELAVLGFAGSRARNLARCVPAQGIGSVGDDPLWRCHLGFLAQASPLTVDLPIRRCSPSGYSQPPLLPVIGFGRLSFGLTIGACPACVSILLGRVALLPRLPCWCPHRYGPHAVRRCLQWRRGD
jgi:hypothetical protein